MGVVKRQEKELNNFYEDDEDFEEDDLEVLEQGKYYLSGYILPFTVMCILIRMKSFPRFARNKHFMPVFELMLRP